MKFCRRCGYQKPLSEFQIIGFKTKAIHHSYCKCCKRAYEKALRCQ